MDEVVIPAGTYRAVRVDWEYEVPRKGTARGSDWFAPGAGKVKTVVVDGPGAGNVMNLSPFEPVRSDPSRDSN
jgi:hypothetical protein